MSTSIHSLLLCGVGGQGILLAAKVVGAAAESAGLDVAANEIHGMAQRGGSVRAFVPPRWSRSGRCAGRTFCGPAASRS